jgi:hypothetical protein
MIKDVQAIVDHSAVKYNCSFSVAVKAPKLPSTLTWAAGGATTDSKFAWGSITKMWTGSSAVGSALPTRQTPGACVSHAGASIMQLVASGALTLDTPAAPIVDAQLAAMKKINFPGLNFTTLAELYGPDVGKVTIHNLLAMQSGIPDFDTANPSRIPGGKDKDSFRASVYANPNQDFLEPALMSVPWVALGKLESTPGTGFHYSSTNFGILGLILAHFAQEDDYRYFNQSSFLQAVPALAALRSQIDWGVRGSPADLGVINGFDRTDYNGQVPRCAVFCVLYVRSAHNHVPTQPADGATLTHCVACHAFVGCSCRLSQCGMQRTALHATRSWVAVADCVRHAPHCIARMCRMCDC